MIDIKNVTKTYSKNKKKAVDDLTLHVEGGELFGFIGPNGAGKTTTIKLITGVLKPDGGEITMAGHRMDTDRLEAQRLIGYVPGAVGGQSQSVLSGIFAIATLVPALGFFLLAAALAFWYPLHKKQVEENTAQLRAKHGTSKSDDSNQK